MLKYQPTRFWGMLKGKSDDDICMPAEKFAAFNQNLFYNEKVIPDKFVALDDVDTAKLTVSEVQNVLSKHFKANKSTGLSVLPL